MNRLTSILLALGTVSSIMATDYTISRKIASFDFEEAPTDHGWRSYDLDGKSTYFFGYPRGWYMSFDGDNGVCAATSLFNYNVDNNNFVTPVTVPANDWLFSPAVEIPAEGSFRLSWDSRAGGNYDMEDYEIRVIDADLLDRLEAGFTPAMTLTEVAQIMMENSTFLSIYECQDNKWKTHSLSINSLRGQKVRFIWRYCSDHTQVVYMDNFLVEEEAGRSFDVNPVSLPGISATYASVPSFMIEELPPLALEITNVDNHALENVSVNVSIKTDNDGEEFVLNEIRPNIESSETITVTIPFEKEEAGLLVSSPYTLTVTTTSPSGNEDVVTIRKEEPVEISENMIAWETGDTPYHYSIGGAEAGKEIGQRFPIWHDVNLKTVRFRVSDISDAGRTTARVYEPTETGDYTLIGQSEPVSISEYEAGTYDANLTEPVKLSAGKTYIVSLTEPSGKKLGLLQHNANNGRIAVTYVSKDGHWVEAGYNRTLDINLLVESSNTGIMETATESTANEIRLSGNAINLYGTGRYSIVDFPGNTVASGTADRSATISLDIPKGLYIVNFENAKLKFVL